MLLPPHTFRQYDFRLPQESILHMFHMQIFFFCRKPAADMTLRLVHVQNLTRLCRQCRVDEYETFSDIFMYGCYYLERP